jgi:bifunctional non-homologous end joining protein LigD
VAADRGLEEYRRKRDFKKTPEPPPRPIRASKEALSYLIQKHDATRLHYDFRLELAGVLLSWAVTKGPSINPADKRLAVRTEDHPLSYGSFEGTIPKEQYGGGTVMLWDRGTWEPTGDPQAGLKKGHLSFVLHGERLKGAWNLIRMRGDGKRENWLLVKKNDTKAKSRAKNGFLDDLSYSVKSGRSMDEIAQGKSSLPNRKATEESRDELKHLMKAYPEVQLATLVDTPPEGMEWLHEIKLDGYRLLGFVSDGASRLRTRNGKDWTERFPSLTAALEKLRTKSGVLDMEAVVLDAEGKSSFQALQAALGAGRGSGKVIAYAFDLLHLDGQELTKLPLLERKEKLRVLLKKSNQHWTLRYSDHIVGRGADMFAKSCSAGLEGIVSKKADAFYVAGRQKSWLKTKCVQRQEFIILGFSRARTGDRALGAIYLGYRKDGAIHYAGKAGTGFSMKEALELAERFERLAIQKPSLTRAETEGLAAHEWRSIHWIKPVLLCEVAFTEWTQDGRIRHPSFQGLREDKDARDVKKEMPVPSTATSKRTASKKKAGTLVAAGITITHPDRVISETGHITKGELAEYYVAVAPVLLPRIVRRPLSLLRCPSGIDGECFYQRNPGKGLGTDVHAFEFRHKGKRYEYLYIEDTKGLLEVIQMGAIEIHPWGASIDAIDYPDRLIFDLDPGSDVSFEALKLAAQDLRQRLKQKGLESTLKCTGGKGLHVIVPLAGKDKWMRVKSFAGSVAEQMVADVPEAYIATMSKAKRTGKIFIDYFRNDYTATAIADYAVRARPGAPVALPLEWKELKDLKAADQFTMKDALKRLKNKRQDRFARQKAQTIPAP